jgi:RNA polymerase subunit RPABC4/transcription elongation factor Spt4
MIETDDDLIELLMIPSVGRVKAQALHSAGFHTLQDISKATPEELHKVPGISIHMAKSILDFVGVMLGSQDDVVMKEKEESPSLFVCPLCGSMVGSSTNECPGCGVVFSDEDEEIPLQIDEKVTVDEAPKLFICPECGSLISEGAEKCVNCGVVFEVEDVIEELPLEMEPEQKGKEEDGFWYKDKSELFMCPNCGAFIASDAGSCNECGAFFAEDGEGDEEEEGPESIEEKVIPDEKRVIKPGDDSSLIICPRCESLLPPDTMRCNNCGTDITVTDESRVQTPIHEEDKDGFWYKDDDSLFMCPNCGAFIKSNATSCATCGVTFEEEEEEVEKTIHECPNCNKVVASGSEDCPSCGFHFEVEKDDVDGHWYKDDASLFVCPNCGSFISETAKSCNQCGIVFEGEEEAAEPIEFKDESQQDVQPSLYLCTECGAFMSASADKCTVCGAEIEDDDALKMDIEEDLHIPEVTEELSAEIAEEIKEIEAEKLEPPKKDIEELIMPKAKRGISKDFLSRWQKKEEEPISAVKDFKTRWDTDKLDEEAIEKELELDLLEVPEKTEIERLDDIDTALYSNPMDPELWVEKANILVELGQQDDAIACLDKAAELDPEKETDYKRRILTLLGVGIEEEMTDLSEFLDLEMEEVTFDEALIIDKTEAEIDVIDTKRPSNASMSPLGYLMQTSRRRAREWYSH